MNSSRDWGYADDYIKAMHLILQQKTPNDYIIATGETHKAEDFVQLAFKTIGIENWREYIEISSLFIRPSEVDYLRGDSSKAREKLGWKPKVDFAHLVRKMVAADAGF